VEAAQADAGGRPVVLESLREYFTFDNQRRGAVRQRRGGPDRGRWSMSRTRRVVVTGVGVVCPLGLDLATFRRGLLDRVSGIRPVRAFDASALPVRLAGELEGFDARNYLEKKDRKSLKMMAYMVQLAVAASRLALDDAALKTPLADPDRLGVSFGIGTIPGQLADLGPASRASFDPALGAIDNRRWGKEGMAELPPMWMLNHVPNMASCHVSILHDARGPNNTITQSDAASLLALGEAVNVIQREAADVVLAGGVDTRAPLVAMIRYPLFTQMSRLESATPRPFDARRDGTVMGDGGAVLVLEELGHAQGRGARIYAELLGYAAGFDRGRGGDGLARVVRQAMERAGVGAGEIDHVNAHAPGTTEDDEWEARGLADVAAPVVAMKSYFGNLGAGAAAAELAASLLGMAEGWRPGTLNHDETDPGCPVDVARETASARAPCVLKVSGTEQGQCAAMVLRRWGERAAAPVSG
jgi:3-oxoacyl-[acyl-carrier-protein] synthase II